MEKKLVGVYDGKAEAEAARADAMRAGATDARVGHREDVEAALLGEMREEAEHTVVGPGNIGPFTKEMLKGMAILVPSCALLVGLLMLPLGLVVDGPVTRRLLIGFAIGAAAGATLSFVIGGSLGAGRQARRRLAAERGVVVSATIPDPATEEQVKDVMAGRDPIRLDAMAASGAPQETVTTEESHTEGGVVEDMADQLRRGEDE